MTPNGIPNPTLIATVWDEGDKLFPVGVGQVVFVIEEELEDVIDEESEQVVLVIDEAFT